MKRRRFDRYFNIFGFPLSGAGKIHAGFRVYLVLRYALLLAPSGRGICTVTKKAKIYFKGEGK